MIQNFLLIEHLHDEVSGDDIKGCKLEQKLKNISDAKVALPIIADTALWQISSQLQDTNEKKDLETQTDGHLVFFITDGEAQALHSL